MKNCKLSRKLAPIFVGQLLLLALWCLSQTFQLVPL